MTDITWTNTRVRLGDLKPWADNPRMSSKAQAKRLLTSFEKFGQVQTVAVDPACNVLDGHQRLSALLTIHGKDYELDARQSNRPLTEKEQQELVISLHAGAVGSWDWQAISSWDSDDLQSWGMDKSLLDNWGQDYSNLKGLTESEDVPDFQPVGVEEQGRLDQKKPVECPNCGHEFVAK
jgi:ParB family chromosome partitioning protein